MEDLRILKARPGIVCRWHRPVSAQGVATARTLAHGLLGIALALCKVPVDSATVRKTVVFLLVLFCMLWQSIAMTGAAGHSGTVDDFAHTLLHWQDEGHHHHGDGSYHADDSADSSQHVALDGALSPSALPCATHLQVPSSVGMPQLPSHEAAFADPDVDGLRRPPRLTS
jgi:hypothetical protein